jgi:hypothetical protein
MKHRLLRALEPSELRWDLCPEPPVVLRGIVNGSSLRSKKHFRFERQMNFLLEAVIVGLLLIPVFFIVEKAKLSKTVTVFLAGVLFHVLAELTGINRAYVISKQ